jgi:hypothetical protein
MGRKRIISRRDISAFDLKSMPYVSGMYHQRYGQARV